MHTKLLSIHRYNQDVSVNKSKGRWFPSIRGTWLPCFDLQHSIYIVVERTPTRVQSKDYIGGIAINWLGVRVRISLDLEIDNGKRIPSVVNKRIKLKKV